MSLIKYLLTESINKSVLNYIKKNIEDALYHVSTTNAINGNKLKHPDNKKLFFDFHFSLDMETWAEEIIGEYGGESILIKLPKNKVHKYKWFRSEDPNEKDYIYTTDEIDISDIEINKLNSDQPSIDKLATVIKEYKNKNEFSLKGCMDDPFNRCVVESFNFYDWLNDQGYDKDWDISIYKVDNFLGDPSSAHEKWKEIETHFWVHYLVKIENFFIDFTAKQFNKNAKFPEVYSENELKDNWEIILEYHR